MPITMTESIRSPVRISGGNSDGLVRVYDVVGDTDVANIVSHIEANTGATDSGFTRGRIEVEPNGSSDVWRARVNYELDGSTFSPVGTVRETIDTTGGTQRVYQAISQTSYAPAGETAPDMAGSINVDQDGNVNGVDFPVPAYKFTETHTLSDGDVDSAFKTAIFGLVGAVNDASFREFAAGAVRFMGARGQKNDNNTWDFTFLFEASPNRTNIDVGGGITVATKQGHDYLWTYLTEDTDGASNRLVPIPLAAYVAKLAQDGDFSQLGIGTSPL